MSVSCPEMMCPIGAPHNLQSTTAYRRHVLYVHTGKTVSVICAMRAYKAWCDMFGATCKRCCSCLFPYKTCSSCWNNQLRLFVCPAQHYHIQQCYRGFPITVEVKRPCYKEEWSTGSSCCRPPVAQVHLLTMKYVHSSLFADNWAVGRRKNCDSYSNKSQNPV